LVDPVDDEDVEEIRVLRLLVLQRLTMCDLKKWKNINTHPIFIVIDHHFLPYTGLVIEFLIFSNFPNVITDLTPFGD
jgi:hypothetical protein